MSLYDKYLGEMLTHAPGPETPERNRYMQSRIVNTTLKLYGLKTPDVKNAARSVPLAERDEVLDGFFAEKEHSYESVLFAGCLAARKGDYAATAAYLRRIIPLFASWAHVDTVLPCLRWVEPDRFLSDFEYLISRPGQYEVRVYIIFMMEHCLCDDRIDFALDTLRSRITYGEYYVDMAAAWLLAEALVKQYDKTLPLILSHAFPPFVHNKAIQKARESYRISDATKAYLNTLKVPRACAKQ